MAEDQPVSKPAGARGGTGKLILALLVAALAVAVLGTITYFSFAKAPLGVAGFVIVGPECESQPAIRVETAYRAASSKGGATLTEFAGIRFYRNVPWGAAEQSAPVGQQ